MFCPKCGTSVPDGSKFCELCGNSIRQPEQDTSEREQQQEAALKQQEIRKEPQVMYQPAPQPAGYNANTFAHTNTREKVYGVGGWLITMILLCIPIVNIILAFVWAFSGSVNKNKKNFAIAWLIMMIISIIISIVLYASIMAMIGSIFEQIGGGFGDFIDFGNGF